MAQCLVKRNGLPFKAWINVQANPGAVITATGAGKIFTAVADSKTGIASILVKKKGTYTISSNTNAPNAYTDNVTRVVVAKNKQIYQAKCKYRYNGYISLSATSGSMASGSSSVSITVTKHHGGSLSVSRSSGSVATASISGTTVKMSRSGTSAGTVKFTVTSAQTEYYTSASATFTLSVSQVMISFVLAMGGTDSNYRCTSVFSIPAGSTLTSLYNAGYNDRMLATSGKYINTTKFYSRDGSKASLINSARFAVYKWSTGRYTIYAGMYKSNGGGLRTDSCDNAIYIYGSSNTLGLTSAIANGQWYNMYPMYS